MTNIRPELMQGTSQLLNEINKKQSAKSTNVIGKDENFRKMIDLVHQNNTQEIVPALLLEDVELVSQIIELARRIKTSEYPAKKEETKKEVKYVYIKTNLETPSGVSNFHRFLNTDEKTTEQK